MIRVWAGQLRAIVWLDASDGVVWHRINERAQEHKTKGKPREVGHQFVNRYRDLFEETLSYVEGLGRTEIMRFDTSETSSEELAAEVRVRLNAGAAREQSRPSEG
jgi:hypothetical protein